MSVRIFKPSKKVTQSGKLRSQFWVLEFDKKPSHKIEPFMGYTSCFYTQGQVRLIFPSCQEAIAYAKKNGLEFSVEKPESAKRPRLCYADNFSSNRFTPWTH